MHRSKNQIKNIGIFSIGCLVVAIILEFHLFGRVESCFVSYFSFLHGHRAFCVNFLIGCACSGGVLILSEYIEYIRIERKLVYEIDAKLRSAYSVLKNIDKKESLIEIREYRDEILGEYKKPFVLVEYYSPFKGDKRQKEISEKLDILDYKINQLFYGTLDIYIRAESKKYEEYYQALQDNTPEGKLRRTRLKQAIEKSSKYHLNEIKSSSNKLRRKIEKYVDC